MRNYHRPRQKREAVQITREDIEQMEVPSQIDACYLGRKIKSLIEGTEAPRITGEWTVYSGYDVAVGRLIQYQSGDIVYN